MCFSLISAYASVIHFKSSAAVAYSGIYVHGLYLLERIVDARAQVRKMTTLGEIAVKGERTQPAAADVNHKEHCRQVVRLNRNIKKNEPQP